MKVYYEPVGIARYSGRNGSLIDSFYLPREFQYGQRRRPIAVGPDGNLYIGEDHGSFLDYGPQPIRRFNPVTGALIDIFVPAGSGGLLGAFDLIFGPDGHLYVITPIGPDNVGGRNILRYDGTSGAFLGEFVAAESGGLQWPESMAFGPDGNLYVADGRGGQVFRYNGTTGTFIDQFVSNPAGGFRDARLAFGPDGDLYLGVSVPNPDPNKVLRYDGTTGALLGNVLNPSEHRFRNQQGLARRKYGRAFAPGARPMASRAALVAGDYANRPRHCDRHRRCTLCQNFGVPAESKVTVEPAVSVKNDVGQGTATAKLCSGPTIDGYVSAKTRRAILAVH